MVNPVVDYKRSLSSKVFGRNYLKVLPVFIKLNHEKSREALYSS
jgi:hypothetical protein